MLLLTNLCCGLLHRHVDGGGSHLGLASHERLAGRHQLCRLGVKQGWVLPMEGATACMRGLQSARGGDARAWRGLWLAHLEGDVEFTADQKPDHGDLPVPGPRAHDHRHLSPAAAPRVPCGTVSRITRCADAINILQSVAAPSSWRIETNCASPHPKRDARRGCPSATDGYSVVWPTQPASLTRENSLEMQATTTLAP
jgi:hypothetical protein